MICSPFGKVPSLSFPPLFYLNALFFIRRVYLIFHLWSNVASSHVTSISFVIIVCIPLFLTLSAAVQEEGDKGDASGAHDSRRDGRARNAAAPLGTAPRRTIDNKTVSYALVQPFVT